MQERYRRKWLREILERFVQKYFAICVNNYSVECRNGHFFRKFQNAIYPSKKS